MRLDRRKRHLTGCPTVVGPPGDGYDPWMRLRWALTFPLMALMGLGLIGCNDPLFPEDVPRSPYARYSDLRGQNRAKTEKDAFGRPQPALRERLAPLE